MNYTLNQVHIARTFRRLHRLAWHSSPAIQKKWLPAYKRWCSRHMPVSASPRYLQAYTIDTWL